MREEADQRWHVKGDPTEGALVVAAAKAGLHKADLDTQFPRVNEIPFTSETKRMTTLHTGTKNTVAYSKGAPEIILDSCGRELTAEGETALDLFVLHPYSVCLMLTANKGIFITRVVRQHSSRGEACKTGIGECPSPWVWIARAVGFWLSSG